MNTGYHCSNCKADIQPEAIFCYKCGEKFDDDSNTTPTPAPTPTPAKKNPITIFFAIIGMISMCFAFLVVYGIIKDLYVFPYLYASETLTARPAVTLRATHTPTKKTPIKTPTSVATCLPWSQITTAMTGKTVCVYGTVASVYKNYQVGQFYIYFEDESKFFLTSELAWEDIKGKCVNILGTVQLNTYRVPYMLIDDLYYCP